MQTIAIPVFVTPWLPAPEQKAPGVTPRTTERDVVVASDTAMAVAPVTVVVDWFAGATTVVDAGAAPPPPPQAASDQATPTTNNQR